MSVLIAQISDTHVLDPTSDEERWVDNNRRLAQAVRSLNDERPAPAAVLATGDLVNDGAPGELAELASLLEPLSAPLLPIPGNHDDRDGFRKIFDMPWSDEGHLSWAVDLGPIRVVGLDTVIPGEHGGALDGEREGWLRATLAAGSDRPTLIAMHHPPFTSGIASMDCSALTGAATFAAVLSENCQVLRVGCGHLHRPVQATVAGVATSVGLSTVHHVALDLDPTAPIQFIRDPAGYQLHHFDGASWVTHTRYIDKAEEAFVPSWALGER